MTPEQHEREKELFHQLKNLAPEQRKAALASACPDDSEVRAKVEKVLEQHDQQKPTARLRPKVDSAPQTPIAEDSQIGKYRILRPIGAGAMGAVYAAEQDQPKRTIALKVIKVSSDPERMRRYFDREVELLGQLKHPGIAQIYDAGIADTHSGPQPFFAMELIEGRSLTAYATDRSLGTRQRLELMIKICEGVQHAHQKGVIHRDLKPGNILVDESGQPKILDFGLARATDSDMQAATDSADFQVVGTINYMSPEQAIGRVREIDTRTDIYALGVVTYELLTGKLPHELSDKTPFDALRIVREDDPAPLSSIDRAWRGDVEWIVAKALEKDKNRRYGSAAEFAADLTRHLKHEPVVAGPPSATYRLGKFVRRHRLGVTSAAVILLALLMATGVSTRFGLSEAEQRRIAEGAQKQAEDNLELAQKREREATEARDQTQIVADFQSSMLGETDAEGMGLAIVDGFEVRIRAVLAERIEDQRELDRIMHEWRQRTLKAGPTTVALEVLDEFVLAKAADTVDKDFADQPLVRAALQQAVARTYREIGLFEPAMPLQEAGLATRREELGDDHPDTLRSINNMGRLLTSMGKLTEAEPYYREALEGRRRVLGDDHPDTLISIGNRGVLLNEMGRNEEAERYYREALDNHRRLLGDEHPDTLISINNMGVLLQAMGKLKDALPYYREALKGRRRVLGDDHSNTLGSINNMATLLQSMGKLAEAESYYRDALKGRRRVLGDDHPDTLNSISNMGSLLQAMGKLPEAEPYRREALEGCRRVLGDDHQHTLASIGHMGGLLQSMGKLADAEPYYREALEGSRRVLGDDHPVTLSSINNMGGLLRSSRKLAEAEPYVREALEARRRILGNDHPRTLISIHNLGRLLHDLDRSDEAEMLGAEAVRRAKRSLPDGHWFTGLFLVGYAETLEGLERYADTEAALLEAQEILNAALGPEHKRPINAINALVDLYTVWDAAEPDKGNAGKAAEWRAKLPAAERADSLIELGMGLLKDGRHAEAEAPLGACLDIRQEALPEGHWLIFNTTSVLGESLAGQDKFAEAEALLLDGYEGMKDHDEATNERKREALERVVNLYETWHAAEPHEGYDGEAAEWQVKLEEEGAKGPRDEDEGTEMEEPASQAPGAQESSTP